MEKAINKENLERERYNALHQQIKEFGLRLDRIEGRLNNLSGTQKEETAPAQPTPHIVAPARDRVESIEAEIRRLTQRLEAVNTRAGRMRFDRQILSIPEWFRFKRKTRQTTNQAPVSDAKAKQILILCPVYPGGSRAYGGEFIHKRAKGYVAAGLQVTVIEVSKVARDQVEHTYDGVGVIRTAVSNVRELISDAEPDWLCIHQLELWLWAEIRQFSESINICVWIHGFEARDWKELEFNYSPEEKEKIGELLESVNRERKQTMSELFQSASVSKVFVSDYMKRVAETFAEKKALNSLVIPNVIDEKVFRYVKKDPKIRFKVLWVRSFAAKNYGNDLAQEAISILATRDVFKQLSFSVFGDGKLFDETVAPLRDFSNVSISQGFVDLDRLIDLHSMHGIMLVPTRWDSQGLTVGEAMSSGLVPVTNRVAAIPEFVDEKCGMMCAPNDPEALADAIERLVDSPELFARLSIEASKRAQSQCGNAATIKRELGLLTR